MDIDHFFILLAALNNLQATGHCKVKTMDVENNHRHDFEPRKNEFACQLKFLEKVLPLNSDSPFALKIVL